MRVNYRLMGEAGPLLRMTGGLQPPPWIERQPAHERHLNPEALVDGLSLDP